MLYKIIDFLMPHRCQDCGCLLESENALCESCWKEYSFINEPFCNICGTPFEIEIDSACLSCLKKKPPYEYSRSILKYNQKSKKLILKFKYQDKTHLSSFFAKIIFSKYQHLIDKYDLITCVPMHRLKRLFRLYNQAQILAHNISCLSKIEFIPDILIKSKYTKSQTLFSRTARKNNLKNSIILNKNHNIQGKKIILIDDVVTTGETIKICSKALKSAGAKSVLVLSVAKNYIC